MICSQFFLRKYILQSRQQNIELSSRVLNSIAGQGRAGQPDDRRGSAARLQGASASVTVIAALPTDGLDLKGARQDIHVHLRVKLGDTTGLGQKCHE